jgi:hypothetical protein
METVSATWLRSLSSRPGSHLILEEPWLTGCNSLLCSLCHLVRSGFYRGYVFAVLEWMARTLRDESDAEDAVAARAQVTTLLETVRGSLAQLLLVGYDSFTMEEFHEYFLELFQWAVDDKPTSEQIRERLTADQGLDQYIVSDKHRDSAQSTAERWAH